MKRHTLHVHVVLALGLGLTLALLWLLGNATPPPSTRAADLSRPAGGPGDVLCVALEGGGPYPGCTQVFTNVQAAVDAASGGEIIKVATGMYTGVSARDGITQVAYISKTVTVQGGYTTTNWTTPYPITQLTTLDAKGQGRVLYITGNISPTIEGLRISGGNATGLGGPWGDAGGGIFIITATATLSDNQVSDNASSSMGGGLFLNSSPATISGNTISSNSAIRGGGLYLYKSSATLNENTMTANTTPSYMGVGGGLFLQSSNAMLSSNTIFSNTSETGGGLFLGDSNDTLIGNLVTSNTASYGGGGLFLNYGSPIFNGNTFAANLASSFGGGVYMAGTGTPEFIGNTVSANTSRWRGGGLCLYELYGNVFLSGNVITANIAEDGGGVYMYGSKASFNDNLIVSNTASSDYGYGAGGGLYIDYSNPVMTNNVVADNHARATGSGLYINGIPRLLQTTIARNTGGDGSGIVARATLTLTNTILVNHTLGVSVTESHITTTLDGVLWFGNGTNTGGAGAIRVTNPTTGNPAFASDGYHLCPSSAAKDKGVNTSVATDIDGDIRPWGNGFDIGADEYTSMFGKTSLHLAQVATDTNILTATLMLGPVNNVVTSSLRYATSPIGASNWAIANVLSDALPGNVSVYTAVVPYNGGHIYFALKYWDTCDSESPVPINVFWPHQDIYLPLVMR